MSLLRLPAALFLLLLPIAAPALLLAVVLLRLTSVFLANQLFVRATPSLRRIPRPPPPPESPLLKYLLVGHNYVPLSSTCTTTALHTAYRVAGPARAPFISFSFLHAPRLFLTSLHAVQHVLVDKTRVWGKTTPVRRLFGDILGRNGIFLSDDGDHHSRIRRTISPAFHVNSMALITHIFDREGAALVARWEALARAAPPHAAPPTIDLRQEFSDLTLQIIADAAFGLTLEPDSPLRNDFNVVFNTESRSKFGFVVPVLIVCFPPALVNLLPIPVIRDRNAALRRVRDAAEAAVRARATAYRDPGHRADLLDMLLQHRQDLLSDDEVVDHCMTVMAAGQVTTAVLLTWIAFELAWHPRAQARLRREIGAAFAARANGGEQPAQMTHDDVRKLQKLPYLDAVVKEGLRKWPPLSLTSRQALRDDVVAGTHVPEGVVCSVPIMSIHRDPAYWGPDAHLFKPERWLSDRTDTVPHNAFIPFLRGSRSCIGQNFALYEVKTILKHICQSPLRFRCIPGDEIRPANFVVTPQSLRMTISVLPES